jgi:uncharacterized repeat protein (TIGR03803 family)
MKYVSVAAGVWLGAAACVPANAHRAPVYTLIFSFPGGSGGVSPLGTLIEDQAGNLYGTTAAGGVSQPSIVGPEYGVVFEMTPQGVETVLHEFGIGKDGADPRAGVIADGKGNLYGTTAEGGPTYNGTVFRVAPGGKEKVLHKFASDPDGALPQGGLLAVGHGDFVGTTTYGGSAGAGTVYQASTKRSDYKVLFSFTGSTTGTNPTGPLIRDSAGNLYGVASGGGSADMGAVFMLSPSGTETLLYSFQGGNDGSEPYGGLVSDTAGNLYGVTYSGGSSGYGTLFEIAPGGTETLLHTFTGTQADGSGPYAAPIRDKAGNLYGTTSEGGASYMGTVFEFTSGGSFELLHSFAGADGSAPLSGLLRDKQGNLWGTTSLGGATNDGTVFELTP